MREWMRVLRVAVPALAVAGILGLVNCGGGGSSTTPTASSPVTAPTQAGSGPLSSSFALPTGGGNLTLPAIGGLTSTLSVAAGAPANDTISVVQSLSAPSNAPAPSSALRSTRSSSGPVSFYAQVVTVTQPTPLNVIVSHFLTITSDLATTSQYYYLELDDITTPTAVKLEMLGPATLANLTLEWDTPAADGSIVLQPGKTYLFQAFRGSTATASPSPAPTTSPVASASPSPLPTASSSPVPQPSAEASATPSIASGGGMLTLPTFGGYSGAIPYAPFLGSSTTPASAPLAVLFANFVPTDWPAPLPMPSNPGAVYAIVAITYPLAPGATAGSANAPYLAFQSFTATEPITTTRVSLTIPGLPNFLTGFAHAYHVQGSPPYPEVTGYPIGVTVTGTHVSWVSPFGSQSQLGIFNPGDSVVFVVSQQ